MFHRCVFHILEKFIFITDTGARVCKEIIVTKLLIRLFVKDSKNIESSKVRTSYGVLASIVGIICNIILFTVKIIIGFMVNSISIMADAVNNLSDAASSIVSFVGVKLANRPADKEHPFGHGRFEYIAAFVVSFVILYVGVNLFIEAFGKVLHPVEIGFSWIMVIILSLSLLVKIWLSMFNHKLGVLINSTVMKATSADARNDVIVTSTTIISMIICNFTGVLIDGWVGLIVSIFVLFAGIGIAKDTLMPLLGEATDVELYQKITEKMKSYDGILGSHDLIVHNYGPTHIMATIHAEVPNNAKMEEIHEVIDQIERDILQEMGIFLVIHMDPVEMNDASILESKKMVLNIIEKMEPKASVHDYRVVNGENHANIIFDLVVPYSYKEKQEKELQSAIIEEVSKENPKYRCMITIEKSFVAEE